MTCLAHILDGLHCPGCGTLDALWLDALHGIVECAECGHKARVLVDGPSLLDSLDGLDSLDAVDVVGSCGGGW
ncbi:hypothetical protein ACQP1K_03820 [Sphaerimonospora sp. CA-214678]|uniref:hypothetical protein n=1 Tax=Sphaerimonospora sp. CA-214678 TaxID=3240029 RepID=UPI003D8FBBD1